MTLGPLGLFMKVKGPPVAKGSVRFFVSPLILDILVCVSVNKGRGASCPRPPPRAQLGGLARVPGLSGTSGKGTLLFGNLRCVVQLGLCSRKLPRGRTPSRALRAQVCAAGV